MFGGSEKRSGQITSGTEDILRRGVWERWVVPSWTMTVGVGSKDVQEVSTGGRTHDPIVLF